MRPSQKLREAQNKAMDEVATVHELGPEEKKENYRRRVEAKSNIKYASHQGQKERERTRLRLLKGKLNHMNGAKEAIEAIQDEWRGK